MEKDNLFYQLGQLTFSFVRIDFYLSNIAFRLNLADEELEFFSDSKFEKKLKKLSKDVNLKMDISDGIKEELLKLISEIDNLRKKRNQYIHSIIIQTDKEILLQSYFNKNGIIEKEAIITSIQGLEKLNKEFIDIHNQTFNILQKLLPEF